MKILHINTYDSGGAATGAIQQHQALLSAGVNSEILFLEGTAGKVPHSSYYKKTVPSIAERLLNKTGWLRSAAQQQQEKIRQLGRPFSEGGSYELFSSPYSTYQQLSSHPMVLNADLINLHWIPGFVDIPSFLKGLKKPLVWTLHDMYPYLGGFHYDIDSHVNPQFNAIENEYARIKKDALRDLHYAVAGNSNWNTSEAMKSSTLEHATSFQTIYYPIDPSSYNAIEKETAKKSLNIATDQIVLGFACEDLNNPRKGLQLLINALDSLPSEVQSKLCCLTFGRKNQALSLATGNLIQLGSLDNPRIKSIAYSAMDYFAVPSIAEAFGLTAMEALTCETPVIAANVGGLPELITDHGNGFLFTANDHKSLSECITKALRLPASERISMGKIGRSEILLKHAPAVTASGYIQLYKSLIDTCPAN